MKPIGSILAHFTQVHLSTADEKDYNVVMTPLVRLGVCIFGVPHLWFRMRTRLLLSLLRRIPSDVRMLDAGCGYGLLSMILADERGFSDITMIDLAISRVEHIKGQIREHTKLQDRLRPQHGSLLMLPFRDNVFDVVVSSEVIEHIKEDGRAFSEVARVVKSGGLLIVTVPAHSKSNALDYKKYGHVRPGYTRSKIEALAGENNLVLENYVGYLGTIGKMFVNLHNRFASKALIAITFYPLYAITLLEYAFGWGEANGIIVVLRKSKTEQLAQQFSIP